MSVAKPGKIIGELILVSLFIGALNTIFPQNPGFFKGFINPYLLLALIIAAYYGKYYGFLSLLASALVVLLLLPLGLALVHADRYAPHFLPYWRSFPAVTLLPLALVLLGIYLFGMIRDSFASKITTQKERLRAISRDKGRFRKQLRLLRWVYRELEQRIVRQQDSVTLLYNQIQELYSLDLETALEAILEMVRHFSGADRISIWELRPEARELRLAASHGWGSSDATQTVLPLEGSIEGWVVRNNMTFSVKMLLQYENLRQMDSGRNLITLPINAGRKVWGALNIEEMPFVKYNSYTEKLITMILALAGPGLERALEFETVIRQEKLNPHTRLSSFPQFYTLLQDDVRRISLQRGTLSVIILELVNFQRLVEEAGQETVFRLLGAVSEELKGLSANRANFFHYKDHNQIAVLFPNLDYDGASLFCLETLELLNQKDWKVDDKSLQPEVVLGYAVLGGENLAADDLLRMAENILEMQKV